MTRSALLFIGLVGVALGIISMRATAEVMLPEGPNRALVLRTCGACHDMSLVVATGGQTRDGWEATIDAMTGFGIQITPAERGLIVDYLATYLPPR